MLPLAYYILTVRILMASISHLQFSLLLLSLFNVTLASSSRSSDRDGHNKWVSWNINNYRQKAALKGAESIVETSSHGGQNVLDVRLRLAEMNQVIISVCQNGTGDFKTIREALNTIPLNNTRRVILMIKPGVYRYVISNCIEGDLNLLNYI
jgi:pectinesterase